MAREALNGIDEGAPVVSATEIEIAAASEAVWDVLTNYEAWPSWNPDVKAISMTDVLAEGSGFRWKAGPGSP